MSPDFEGTRPGPSARILVVDDEFDLLQAISSCLEDEGFEVESCTSGTEALDRLEAGDLPDMVLLDVMMPGLSGFDVVERMSQRERTRDLPVVMMSAVSPKQVQQPGSWKAFLRKPFDLDKLLETVRRWAGS